MTSTGPSRGAAIVTGAAQGIGRAIALRLARDGYDMTVNDLAQNSKPLEALAEEIRSLGQKALVFIGDISQEQVVQDLMDQTVAELGGLYVMVANAGIGGPPSSVVTTSLETWDRFIAVNLTGVFLCYRAAARQMLKQGHGGRIIGASSAYGKRAGIRAAPYSSSKFGVRGLTQALATELAEDGITVNAYAPGFIETQILTTALIEDQVVPRDADKELFDRRMNNIRRLCPMQKLGTTENVAALVSYLASDEADFMTGQSVSINGGLFYD